MNVNRLIGLLAMMTTGAYASPGVSQYPCDQPVVIAKTVDTGKTLQICLSGTQIAYTFGDIDVLIDPTYARFEAFKYNQTFEVRIDDKAYRYSYYPKYDFDTVPEKIIGVDKNSIRVFDHDTLVEEIPLDTPQVQRIDASLIKFGVRNIIQ